MIHRFCKISLAILSLAFAGCGGQDTSSSDKVVVRMWTFPMLPELRDQVIYDELVERFNEEHPDIDVQIETLPWAGRTQKMITAIAGNRAPDCVYLNLDLVAQMVARDALQPVDPYMTAESKSEYDPEVMEAITIDGHQWIFPILRTVYAGLYNRTILADVGLDPDNPPRTWAELRDMAEKTTRDLDGDGRADQFGFGVVLAGDSLNHNLWPLLWQAGGQVFSDDGKRVTFNSEAGLEALTFLTDMFRSGYIPHSFLSATGGTEFARGRVAYFYGAGSVEVEQLRRDVPNLDFAVAPIPSHKERVGYSSVAGYAMFKSSQHPEETAAWLNFITRPENMRYFCKSTNFFPCKPGVGSLYDDDPLMSQLEAELPYTRPDINHVYARQVPMLLLPEVQRALLGEKEPAEVLRDAEIAVNAMMERGQ